jgi:NAD(P)-dependent dehydrogenase (short-subunit alcohol dehydrogenase family)
VNTPKTGVIITGGASGIGLATATALVKRGRPVALWDLGTDRVRDAVERCGGDAPVFGAVVDVTDAEQVHRALHDSIAATGSMGGLVHSAGNVIAEPIGDIDWNNWASQLDVHLTSYASLVHQ